MLAPAHELVTLPLPEAVSLLSPATSNTGNWDHGPKFRCSGELLHNLWKQEIKAIGLPNPPLPKSPAALIWGPSWAVLETLLEHHCGAGLPGQGTGEN